MFTRGPSHADEIMDLISASPAAAADQLGIASIRFPRPTTP